MGATPEPDPPLFRDALVASDGERAVLETFLDLYRDAIVGKVRDVSEEDARRRLVASATTLGGIVKAPAVGRAGPRPPATPWTTSRPISGWARSPCDGSTST
jgi:hypothetical protein